MRVHENSNRFSWNSESEFRRQVINEISTFIEKVCDNWTIAWCAGSGHFGASRDDLQLEQTHFASFVDTIANLVPKNKMPLGRLVFASSAGAVYSGTNDIDIDESSSCVPLSPYGEVKISQELKLEEVANLIGLPTICARISTVYGPKQNINKPQGILSRLCVAMVKRKPMPIFVGLETSRNYIYSADVGLILTRLAILPDELVGLSESAFSVKNVVSPFNLTIAQLLKGAEAVFKRRPQVALRIDERSANYQSQFNIRSVVMPEVDKIRFTPLEVGLDQVRLAIMRELQRGKLAV